MKKISASNKPFAETVVSVRQNGTRSVQILIKGDSMTEQSHREKCNINSIMKRYIRTGMAPQIQGARYGDFTSCNDFQDAQDRIKKAFSDFMELPSDIRDMFENDPGNLIEFLNDPENEDEAVEMGLLPKKAADTPEPVEVPENETPAVE